MPRGKYLFQGELRHRLSQGAYAFERRLDLFPTPTIVRNDTRDGLAVTRDDNGLTLLNLAEKLGKPGLCVGGLNVPNRIDQSS